jgi:hypothetical protein
MTGQYTRRKAGPRALGDSEPKRAEAAHMGFGLAPHWVNFGETTEVKR